MNWVGKRWSLSEMRTSVAELNWSVRRWLLSEVRTSVAELNYLDGYPLGRRVKGSLESNVGDIVLMRGFPSQNERA